MRWLANKCRIALLNFLCPNGVLDLRGLAPGNKTLTVLLDDVQVKGAKTTVRVDHHDLRSTGDLHLTGETTWITTAGMLHLNHPMGKIRFGFKLHHPKAYELPPHQPLEKIL